MREIKKLKDIETLTVKSVKIEDRSLVIFFDGYDDTPLKVSAIRNAVWKPQDQRLIAKAERTVESDTRSGQGTL